MQDRWVPSLDQEDPLGKEMATHSSILAWGILWTEEPGRLCYRVAKSQSRLKDLARMHACTRTRAHTHAFVNLILLVELESLLTKVKEESEKTGLKLSVQKTKTVATVPIPSWQIDGETAMDCFGLPDHWRW